MLQPLTGGLTPLGVSNRLGLNLPAADLLQFYNPQRDVYTDTGLLTLALDGQAVAGFKDQAGSGYHITQTTSSQRPLYRAAAAGLNNRAGLEFNAANSQQLYRDATSLVANLDVYTLYTVFSTAESSVMAFYGEGGALDGPLLLVRFNGGATGKVEGIQRDDDGTIAIPNLIAAGSADGAPHLVTLRRIGAGSWSLRLDGGEIATSSAAPGTTTITRITLGSRYGAGSHNTFMDGLLGAVALYGADNYATIEPLLLNWYGI